MEGKIPSVEEIRQRVDGCGDQDFRAALRAAFLMCARVSEVVGKGNPSDGYEARGPTPKEAIDLFYEAPNKYDDVTRKEKALVVIVKTAKRDGMERWVGLPADYDPWVKETARYFWSRPEGEKVFPFTRQALGDYARSNNVFEGFLWTVRKYQIVLERAKRDQQGNVVEEAKVKAILEHPKPFTIHSLRDARATSLMLENNFVGLDLAIHGGWAINRAEVGVSAVEARYLDIYKEWKKPFKKLLPLQAR